MKIKLKVPDTVPYSVVVAYRERMTTGDGRYTIYSKDNRVLRKTMDKYELKIWLDIMGLELGRILDERYRLRNFNKKWSPGLYKVFGRAYKLKKRV